MAYGDLSSSDFQYGGSASGAPTMPPPPLASNVGQPTVPGQPQPRLPAAPRGTQQPQPPPQPAQQAFNPYQNNTALMDATTRDQQYKARTFNDWFQKNQPQPPQAPMLMPPPIGGLSSPTDGPPPPSAAYQPNVDGPPAPGTAPVAPQSPSLMPPPTGGSISMIDANGKTTSATGAQLMPPPPQVGDMATLRGQFPNHDAQGNVIPGSYRTVDASAPRTPDNIAAIAKDNARSGPEFHQYLTNDPGYKASQQNIADVKAATAARMSPEAYRTQQQTAADLKASVPQGVPAADWAAMKPEQRASYIQRNQIEGSRTAAQTQNEKDRVAQQGQSETDRQKAESDRIESQRQARDAATARGFGSDVAKVITKGFNSFDKFVDNIGKTQAAKARTEAQRKNGYEALLKQNNAAWNRTYAELKSKDEKDADIEEIHQHIIQSNKALIDSLYPEFAPKPPPSPPGTATGDGTGAPTAQAVGSGQATPPPADPPTEGFETTSASGKPIVYRGGKWMYK